MPDPIRSALHAAALATMTASEREHSEACHDSQPGPGHIRRAAETVAAFLRATRGAVITDRDGFSIIITGSDMNALAAAVEKAARDE